MLLTGHKLQLQRIMTENKSHLQSNIHWQGSSNLQRNSRRQGSSILWGYIHLLNICRLTRINHLWDKICSKHAVAVAQINKMKTGIGHASLDRTINIPQRRTASATADEADAELAMRMVELLNDGRVVQALKKQLYLKELCEKLDLLTAQMDNMTWQLAAKDERIQTLEKTVLHLEGQMDAQEQYSRRSNLRIQGPLDDFEKKFWTSSTRTWVSTRL